MARKKDAVLEQERRNRVMDAVFERLATGSWRSLTLEEVARSAGVSKGLVTYWFRTKDALFVETIRRYHERMTEQLLGLASEPGSSRQRLARIVHAAFPSREAVEREVGFQTEVWSFAKDHPEALHEVRRSYVQFRMACDVLLDIGAAEGFVTTPGRAGLALAIQALVDGFTLQLAFDPDMAVEDARRRLVAAMETLLTA
jgi:AcrR family transcriptional regulator